MFHAAETDEPTRVIPALVLGFDTEILRELRATFRVKFVISEDPSADIQWRALQQLALDPAAPDLSLERAECYQYVKSCFFRFSDIYSRRYQYVSEPVSEMQNAFVIIFNICYRIMTEENVRLLILSNIPHEGYDYVFYLIAKYRKLKIVMCYQSLIPNRFFLCTDIDAFGEFGRQPKIAEIERTRYALPDGWFYMSEGTRDRSYQTKTLLLELAKNPRGIRVALMRHYYAARYRAAVRATTRQPVSSDRYIYFPLHLQPELTTSALGGDYSDQLAALEVLSGLVPAGYRIYVKDNPKQTELQRGPLFFKRLSRLQNVSLLDQKLSSIELIKGSEGVATVTGTAGWEALFHQKPVLVFGRAWYAEVPGVTTYRGGLEFRKFLDNRPATVEAVVEALDEILTKAGRGVVDPVYASLVDSFDATVNAKTVSESIVAYLA